MSDAEPMNDNITDEEREVFRRGREAGERLRASMAAKAAQPPAPEPQPGDEDGSVGLLDYATDEERDGLKRLREDRDAAESEQRRLENRAYDLDGQATVARSAVERAKHARRRALAARALGEDDDSATPTTPAPDEPGPEELADAASELRARAEAKREEAAVHHGSLRSRTIELFKACAERAATDYLEHARRLSELHAGIGAVQRLLDSLGNVYTGATPEVLVGPDWHGLAIPSSDQLRPLRGRGHEAWYKRYLAGGDESISQKAATEAYLLAQREIAALVGEWPLLPRRG